MPNPRVRGLAAALAIVGTLFCQNPLWMAVAWLIAIVPIAYLSGSLKIHARFAAVIVGPVAVAVFLVWGLLIEAPPGREMGTDRLGGLAFAATIVFRLLLLGGILQVTFLTIPAEQLSLTLRRWGIRGNAAVVTLGVFALLPELSLRADQVLTARLARGLAPNRSFAARVAQLPFLLRPLFAWALRSALQRSDSWRQRGILERTSNLVQLPQAGSYYYDVLYLLFASAWLTSNVVVAVNGMGLR